MWILGVVFIFHLFVVINTDIYGSLSLSLDMKTKNFLKKISVLDILICFYNTTVMIRRGHIALHNERARASQVELLIFPRPLSLSLI